MYQIPLGAGLALAHKIRNDGHVAFVLYGDGAANQGQAAEVGAPWLPLLFLFLQHITPLQLCDRLALYHADAILLNSVVPLAASTFCYVPVMIVANTCTSDCSSGLQARHPCKSYMRCVPPVAGIQHGGDLGAASGVCDREQPLRHGHERQEGREKRPVLHAR